MARRRMFSFDVVGTDRFLDMPSSTQNLYFHLGMYGDDDGFVSSPKRIAANCGSSTDDLKLLIAKGYVIPFDSGVIVITDWKVNNQIKSDRYKPTQCTDEKAQLHVNKVGQYVIGTKLEPVWNEIGNIMEPQYSIGKDRLGKDSLGKDSLGKGKSGTATPSSPRFKPPTEDEAIEFFGTEGSSTQEAKRFYDYYTANGWKVGKNSMKDWKAAARNWIRRAGEYTSRAPGGKQQTKADQTQAILDMVKKAGEDVNNGIFAKF